MAIDVDVNLTIVFFAAVASYIFGALWHGPVFGKYWMNLMGFTKNSMKKMKLTPLMAMTLGFIVTLLVAYILAHFVVYMAVDTINEALGLTFWLWLGFQAPIIFGGFLWEGRTFKLFTFNAIYRYLELGIMAVVLAVWG